MAHVVAALSVFAVGIVLACVAQNKVDRNSQSGR